MKKVKVFGDSWAYGSELGKNEKPFSYHLQALSGIEVENFGIEGCAYGHITQIALEESKPSQETFNIVIIPPDTRWYGETDGYFYSIFNLGDLKYFKTNAEVQRIDFEHYYDTFDKRERWFSYNSTLFTYTLHNYFTQNNSNYLFAHNYGNLPLDKALKSMIPKDIFLSYDRSLTAILGGEDRDLYAERKDGPVPEMFTGKYFEGNVTHPNELGHKRIAELIYNNSRFQNWLK